MENLKNVILSTNNSELAFKYLKTEFSHNEKIEELKKDNLTKKIACIIQLDKILSQEEALIFISNLIEHDGLIREAVSIKLNEFMKSEFGEFFQSKDIIKIIVKAIIDVNPSVCRNIVELLFYIKDEDFLRELIYSQLINLFLEIVDFKQKNHIYTKKVFKIYWLLEALSSIKLQACQNLDTIIEKSALSENYTIREKAAKLLVNLSGYEKFKLILCNDDNIYVKRFFNK